MSAFNRITGEYYWGATWTRPGLDLPSRCLCTMTCLAALGRELVKPLVDATEVVVGQKVVASADLADIGVILGTGFAPFLGGPMKARRDGKA